MAFTRAPSAPPQSANRDRRHRHRRHSGAGLRAHHLRFRDRLFLVERVGPSAHMGAHDGVSLFAPGVAAWLVLFAVLWVAHARGMKHAGLRGLASMPWYCSIRRTIGLLLVALVIALASVDGWTVARYIGGRERRRPRLGTIQCSTGRWASISSNFPFTRCCPVTWRRARSAEPWLIIWPRAGGSFERDSPGRLEPAVK